MKLSLEFHQLHRHLRQRAFSCAHCSRTFSRKCILQEHLRIHSPKTYHCQLDKCRRSFHTQYRLAVHVATQHHAYFVETRRLRAASTRERYKMIRESHYMQDRNTYNNSGYYTSYYYQHSWSLRYQTIRVHNRYEHNLPQSMHLLIIDMLFILFFIFFKFIFDAEWRAILRPTKFLNYAYSAFE